jgi:hypothetical protein
VKANCIAVAINGHMLEWLATTDGAAGAFIKANQHPSGGNCFVLTTAGGQKLAGGNGPYGAEEALKKGLARWKDLPDANRKVLPSGKKVTPPEVERCTPPPGGLVLRCFVRNLKADDGGKVSHITLNDLKDKVQYPDWNPIYTEPAHYHVWFKEMEWKSLIPDQVKKGDQFAVPAVLEKRLFRYHLVNGTFGLPGTWRLEDIRAGGLKVTVVATNPVLRLRLEGSALLATNPVLAQAGRGYEAQLLGWLEYDPARSVFTRFDMVALGDYWGGDYEGGRFKRPGKTPLGIAFELAQGHTAVDLAPPLVHMDRKDVWEKYFAAEKK